MKSYMPGHGHARHALVFTAAISSAVMLQVANPTWESAAPTHTQQAYDYSVDRDPATDTFESYRAF
jgi:hypothetical protein